MTALGMVCEARLLWESLERFTDRLVLEMHGASRLCCPDGKGLKDPFGAEEQENSEETR